MIKLLEKLLNIIYIQPCYFCRSTKDDNIICKKCYNKIHFMPPAVLKEYSNVKIYSCCIYDDIIKQLIKGLKYNGKKKLASAAARIMFEYIKELNLKEDYTIIPVPISKQRLKERKYNHMDLAAKEFAEFTKYKYNSDFLVRIKDTKKQYNLNKREREQNIKGAFDINPQNMPDKSTPLLIIDDITSTGITLEEIIKVLYKNGYKNITALTLATPDIWN